MKEMKFIFTRWYKDTKYFVIQVPVNKAQVYVGSSKDLNEAKEIRDLALKEFNLTNIDNVSRAKNRIKKLVEENK